tara:strand:- start:66 stop:581 length:516 start_codon:yes stop_codon:yes gene_type:complete
MLHTPLPRVIEPLKLIEQRVDLDGAIALSDCTRLRDVLLNSEGDINFALQFGKDEDGQRVIKGSLDAVVTMQCQRCLQPVTLAVQGDIRLAVTRHEDAVKALPGYYDPLLLEAPEIELLPLIEQELMLSLPIVAAHPEGECSINSSYQAKEDTEQSKPNPFAVLAELKNQK